jgi:hypothetical protein
MTRPAAPWEPRPQLLGAAHAAGFKLSDPQLGRLHRLGLVPSPCTRSLGRGRGTTSEFPPGSTVRLLRVLEIRKRERAHKFSTIAWRLWWEDGGPLADPARELLVETATRWDHQRDELSDLLVREDDGDPHAERQMNVLYLSMEQGPVEGPLGTIRRNTGREGFSTVARILAEVATGRFESYQDHEGAGADGTPRPGTTGALVERALGLDHARSDRVAGRGPRFTGSSEAHLMLLSELLGDRQLEPLATAAQDTELDNARTEIRGLLDLIATFAPMVERVLGGDTAGYRTIARALNLRTPRSQASILLAWLALRQDPALVENLRDLIRHLPQALAAAELERLSHTLAKEVPALASPCSKAMRANLWGDADETARWRAEIARVSNEHREEIDSFFRRHPEAHVLISTAGEQPESLWGAQTRSGAHSVALPGSSPPAWC